MTWRTLLRRFLQINFGNGLGLSLSKRIVEEHGGKMTVRSSVRPGRNGSVFKIRLPHPENTISAA